MTAVRHFLTEQASGARLREMPALALQADAPPAGADGQAQLLVNTARRFQTLEGFGGAFTEAAAVTWGGVAQRSSRRVAARLL